VCPSWLSWGRGTHTTHSKGLFCSPPCCPMWNNGPPRPPGAGVQCPFFWERPSPRVLEWGIDTHRLSIQVYSQSNLRQPVLVYDLLLAVVLKNMKSLRTGKENRRFFSSCFMKTPHQFLKVFEINGTNQWFFDSELFFQRTRTGGYPILEYLKIKNHRFFTILRNCTAPHK